MSEKPNPSNIESKQSPVEPLKVNNHSEDETAISTLNFLDSSRRLLTFNIGQDQYAIPLLSVKEVIGKSEFTTVPNTPPYYSGLINLRGQVVSIIDLSIMFETKSIDYGESSYIICEHNNNYIGLSVDSVNSVLPVNTTELCQDIPEEGKLHNRFLLGVYRQENNIIIIIDINKLCEYIKGIREAV